MHDNVHNARLFVKSKRTPIDVHNAPMPDDRPEEAKRLQLAREKRGFGSAKDAATFFGWKYDTYIQHERGERGISRAADRYAEGLRVSKAWLLTGEGKGPDGTIVAPQPYESEPNAVVAMDLPPPSQRGGARDLPMRGIAVMGDDGDFSFNGDVADYIPRPPSLLHKRKAFGIYATNDSMEPAYSDGDPVVIDPDRPPGIGDDVVIEMKPGPNGEPGACYLKRLVRRGPPTIIVRQYNPLKDIPFQHDQVLHIYRVVPRRELLGL